MRIKEFFEHKAVLLVLGFGLTTVTGGLLTSHWKHLEWRNQQDYLLQQHDLDKKTELINQVIKSISETNTSAEDILALYYYPGWKTEEIRERRQNWQNTSRAWRVESKILQQQLRIYFADPNIASKFDDIIDKRDNLGNIIVNLPQNISPPKKGSTPATDLQNAKELVNQLRALTFDCGSLMRKEVQQLRNGQNAS